jgi:hypothetical protein
MPEKLDLDGLDLDRQLLGSNAAKPTVLLDPYKKGCLPLAEIIYDLLCLQFF